MVKPKQPVSKPKPGLRSAEKSKPEPVFYPYVPNQTGEVVIGKPAKKVLRFPKRHGVASLYTPERGQVAIDALAKGLTARAAAVAAEVNRTTLFEWKYKFPEFAEAWEKAMDSANEFFEDEARRRATDGYLEPVYQQGVLVGHVRKYSDPLLIMQLKARFPDKYRERTESEVKADQTVTFRVVGGLPSDEPPTS